MMTPLGVPGGSQVIPILKNEGDDDVMTTEPGAGMRKKNHNNNYYSLLHYNTKKLTIFLCLCNNRVTVQPHMIQLIDRSCLNGVVGEGRQSSQ